MNTIRITSRITMYWGIEILLLITIMPITQCFPSIIRWSLQIFSILLFLVGLLLERNKCYFIGYVACVMFAFVYVYNVWKFNQSVVTCVFNVMAGFAFAFYGIIAVTKKGQNGDYQKKVVQTTILLICITALTTIVGLQRYPLAVRELGRVGSGYTTSGQAFIDLKFKYKLMNIASWSIVYGIVFSVPWFLNKFKENRKIKYLLALIIILICLLKSQLTIGIIVAALMLIFSIYKPSLYAKDITVSAAIVLVGFLLIVFRDEISAYIISISENHSLGMVSDKLHDLSLLLRGSQTGDVSARFERYGRSLNIFLEHPFLGLSINGVPQSGLFGNHSDLFDILGYYGIFGAAVLVIIIVRYYRDIKRSTLINNKWNVVVPFLGLILVFTLNPIWYSPQVFATAIMLPCCTNLDYKVLDNKHFRRLLI